MAWGKAHNPDAAPRIGGGGGFVVTWDTNKDFVGCSDPARRSSTSIYGRYIDQNFSYAAGAPPNPAYFVVFQDDSVPMDKCEQPSSVEKGSKPRIAFNEMTNDFVIAYEVTRASGGNSSIGAKRASLNAQNVGEVSGSMMPNILATVDGSSLTSPDVVAFRDNYVLFVSDGSNIRAKIFSSGPFRRPRRMLFHWGVEIRSTHELQVI